ncbi:hypothetical protein D3C81_1448470 [compost metagenome]
MVGALVHSTRAKLAASRMAKVIQASRTLILPVASGRALVRATWPSKLRSAKSLITQPAARISTTPSTKITRFFASGTPSAAIHSAHRVGHSSR